MAAYAGATSLRGDGVEEVGEQIEYFPPEEFLVSADRRILIEDEGREMMEEIHDEWPDEDIVGHMVEDEDEIYVKEYIAGEDEDDLYEDFLPPTPMMGELDEWPDQEYFGVEIDGGDDYDESSEDEEEYEEPETKEYNRDPNSVTLENTDLLGEAVDQYDRREAACGENKSEFKIMLTTDNYGYETKWKLINIQGNKVLASGPPRGSNYADKSTYSGRWCLPPGQYKFQMIDNGRDGICSQNPVFGCGGLRLFLDGQNAGRMVQDKSNWYTKDYPFVVGISSRIDGTPGNSGNSNGNGNNKWCNKVRSVMQVPRGTCTLPNGQRGHRVRYTLQTDKYGYETNMAITMNGGVRMKMASNVAGPNEQKSVEQCLPAGHYKIKIDDIDGVCCRHGQGFIKLFVNSELLLDGGSFTGSLSHEFKLGFDWIGSMSERDCEWWWAHDYRRRDWHTRCYQGKYCNKSYRHLKWSPALKADAKVYAEKLLGTCATTGIKHDETAYGENLAKNKGNGKWGEKYDADLVTSRFVDKEEFWGWNRNAHLTQAMWYSTRYVGCAESVKNMGNNRMCRMQVCRYAKAGNCMMGKYNSHIGTNWMIPMMANDSLCGPMCASRDGCYH